MNESFFNQFQPVCLQPKSEHFHFKHTFRIWSCGKKSSKLKLVSNNENRIQQWIWPLNAHPFVYMHAGTAFIVCSYFCWIFSPWKSVRCVPRDSVPQLLRTSMRMNMSVQRNCRLASLLSTLYVVFYRCVLCCVQWFTVREAAWCHTPIALCGPNSAFLTKIIIYR